MANGQRRGGAQLQRSSTLDTIEQIARISQALTGGARERRQRRDAYTLNYFNEATKGYQSIYDQSKLSAMLLNLDDYNRKNGHKMSVESKDLYNLSRQRVKAHMDEVTHYDSMIGKIDALPNKALTVVEQLAIYDSLNSEEAKRNYANENWKFEDGSVRTRGDVQNELQDYMVEYTSYMRDFFGRHGERVNSQNPYLAARYTGLQDVLVDAVDALGDGLLSEGERKYLKKNLINPDSESIKTWALNRKNETEFLEKQNRETITKSILDYRQLEKQLNSGFTTVESKSSGVTGEGGDDRQVYIGTSDKEKLRQYYSGFYTNEDDITRAINESLTMRANIIWQMSQLKENIAVADESYVNKGGISIADGLNFDTSLAPEGKADPEVVSLKKEKKEEKKKDSTPLAYTYSDTSEDIDDIVTAIGLDNIVDADKWLDDTGLITTDDERDFQRNVADLSNTLGLGPDAGKDFGTGLYRVAQFVDDAPERVEETAEILADIVATGGKKKGIYVGDYKLGEVGDKSLLWHFVNLDELFK